MMKAKEIRRLTIDIRTQYKIKSVNLNSVKSLIEAQGYTIIEFDAFDNNDDISLVVERLDLTEYIIRHKGFTYADSDCRLVFVQKTLDDQEKLIVLSHELGHISCNHLAHAPILGTSVIEEDEANQFSHYLLRPVFTDVVAINSILFRKQIAIVCCLMMVLAGVIGYILSSQKQKTYFGDYYITKSGERYHQAECIFVKGKNNVHRLTIEEFETGRYSPCQICLPN